MNDQNADTFAQGDATDANVEQGVITVNHNVIATIARVATLKVPDVHNMSVSFVEGLAGIIGKGAPDRGVRIEGDDQSVAITLHIVVAFGARIPRVAWQVQNDVRTSVEEMTGKKVREVNVVVQDIFMPEPSEKEPEVS